ncbi:MAG: nucleoside-diphosphate sugar epimerase/dehydratase [Rhodocyclaceae bacterium]|jgi:FlaA1/EpsC-like NDP-sugar epimerase|nr:nucleoside-diphosphate sugar epimerase/dehydratase [Rhodocyclaceae bacterium]
MFLSLRSRSVLVFLADLGAAVAAWVVAFLLRFNFELPQEFMPGLTLALALGVPVAAVSFRAFGLYRGIWVFASLPDLQRIGRAVAVAAVVVPAITLVAFRWNPVIPRSIFFYQPILLLMFMGGLRAAFRTWKEHRLYGGLIAQGKPVLVLGAGMAGANLARELARSAQWRVAGFLDDDPAKRGREVQGARVLGSVTDLERWARRMRARHAIIAMPGTSGEVRSRVARLCVQAGVQAMVLPPLLDVLGGHGAMDSMRQLDVQDLLAREPVSIESDRVAGYLRGKVVMVTGAGGSIGAELCRQIARFAPAQMVLFELSEFALYRLLEEFAEHFPDVLVVGVCGDVKDGVRLQSVIGQWRPEVIFHAAAYKHVPLMEDENAWEAVRNNVFGTAQVASAAVAAGVREFVLVSTDKAVNPTNVMGATKRLAEMVCQAMGESGVTRFEIVRFGNVIGSAGSVIPKFQAQIARGGPVTVTHPDITRYFMSIPEAAQLVLQAGAMGRGGEIFVMDMGEPVRVLDLAKTMIRLAGHNEQDIPIQITGLRPGEKLFEELLADGETTRPTHHPKLRIARAEGASPDLLSFLWPWLGQRRYPSAAEVRRELGRWVPEYVPPPPLVLVSGKASDHLA